MSKFKAAATRDLPETLLNYLDSNEFAEQLLYNVLGGHLGVQDATERPAAHFVQEMDRTISVQGNLGIELTLSKISVRDGRNFGGALREMEAILTSAIRHYVPKGERVQIFCVIATDAPVYGSSSTLTESDEVWVEGDA